MFQTVSPFVIKYDLTINSKFGENAHQESRMDSSTGKREQFLLVWEHSAIQHIASKLGVKNAQPWHDDDFDGIWIIDFTSGTLLWTCDQEGIDPSEDCSF